VGGVPGNPRFEFDASPKKKKGSDSGGPVADPIQEAMRQIQDAEAEWLGRFGPFGTTSSGTIPNT
jgi:hypothetical protein